MRRSAGRLPAVDPRTLELIHQHNRLDQELYQFAAELCAQQIINAGEQFQERLRRFQMINRILSPGLRFYWKARQISVRTALKKKFRAFPGGPP